MEAQEDLRTLQDLVGSSYRDFRKPMELREAVRENSKRINVVLLFFFNLWMTLFDV